MMFEVECVWLVDRKQQIKQDEEVSVSGVQQGGAVAPGSSHSETRTDQQSGRRIEKKNKKKKRNN